MFDLDAAASAFDTRFVQRAPHLVIASEGAGHRAALRNLFAACSPFAGTLPQPLLDMQFDAQDLSFRASRPLAMRRVVLLAGQPMARIIVDWQVPGASHGVDIAVHPDHRRSGAGLAMLRTWLDIADSEGRICSLDVIANNPARRIYTHLGFVEEPGDPAAPYRVMVRRAVGRASS